MKPCPLFIAGLIACCCSVAEAAEVRWSNLAGGSFESGANWVGGVAAGADDTALFGWNPDFHNFEPVQISFIDDAVTRALVVQDALHQFHLGGHTYRVSSDLTVGDQMTTGGPGDATLVLSNGTLSVGGNSYVGVSFDHPLTRGAVTVQGGGVWNTQGSLRVGDGRGPLGIVNIVEGGKVTSRSGVVGGFAGTRGVVTVLGPGSEWNVLTTLAVSGSIGSGQLFISDGGSVTSASGFVGEHGLVTVSGTGSRWDVALNLVVGGPGFGSLYIQNGGLVSDQTATLGFIDSAAYALVDGSNSRWNTTGTLTLGGPAVIDTGTLELRNGATVQAQSILIKDGGAIESLSTSGTIKGDVTDHGRFRHVRGMLLGTNSPDTDRNTAGKLTINGNFDLASDGLLRLVVTGTAPGQFSQLFDVGNADFHGLVDIYFVNNFVPADGDTFDFIHVTGLTDFAGVQLRFTGVGADFEHTDIFDHGYTLVVHNGTGNVPEPSTWLLFGSGMMGVLAFRKEPLHSNL